VDPRRGQVIKCLALRRPSARYGLALPEWLICTGAGMGRFTCWFGPFCLAADADALNFVRGRQEQVPGSEVVEFEIHCNSPLLPTG